MFVQVEEAQKQAEALAALKAMRMISNRNPFQKSALKAPKVPQEEDVHIGDGYLPPPSWLMPASFSRRLGFDTKRM